MAWPYSGVVLEKAPLVQDTGERSFLLPRENGEAVFSTVFA